MEVEIKVPLKASRLQSLRKYLAGWASNWPKLETHRDVYFTESEFRSKSEGSGSQLI